MKNAVLLVGTFALVLAVMLTCYLAMTGGLAPRTFAPSTTPPTAFSPTPSQRPTPTTSASPTGSAVASASPTRSPTPTPDRTVIIGSQSPRASATGSPLRTPDPDATPGPSGEPGETQTFTLRGIDYIDQQVPEGGQVINSVDGSATLHTTRSSGGEPLILTYTLLPQRLPPGRGIANISANVCGQGSGDFWEVYGPLGADPFEYEVADPGPDGCWNFVNGPGNDLTVLAAVLLGSDLRIDHIDFIVTFVE